MATMLQAQIKVGAERMEEYLPLLKSQRIALVANQTSMVGKTHLLDTLLKQKVNVVKVFAPEHGFRGDHSNGAIVKDGKDEKTGTAIVSLYGAHKKPTTEDLADVDILIFDIQDVGVRFYTYATTMHYIMEACADNNKKLIILDRPNPNGNYIDGPVLDTKFSSFVGLDPVPLIHALTLGEYAKMINGEGWLGKGKTCKLTVITVGNYNHGMAYTLPVAPSPNLPTMESIYLYPSLGLFEGTDVSVGRGTDRPFEIIGKPGFVSGNYEFTPKSIPGKSESPPYKDQICKGFLLTNFADDFIKVSHEIYLYWIIGFYQQATDKTKFFNNDFFDKLAGTDQLRKQIQEGLSIEKIKASWQPDLNAYKKLRTRYLLYKDF